jgi:dUTP pyrophosphatase
MSSFMKVDESVLPSNLLAIKRPLPVEVRGVGQLFRNYETWAYAKCLPEHVPKRKTPGAAGHDLFSIGDHRVPAGGSVMVDTGLACGLSEGHYGKIEGRSSLAIKHDVVPFGGIIDSDYRGNIMVKLFNHGQVDYEIKANDQIAQLIIQKYISPAFKIVSELDTTTWGVKGFGSTGR